MLRNYTAYNVLFYHYRQETRTKPRSMVIKNTSQIHRKKFTSLPNFQSNVRLLDNTAKQMHDGNDTFYARQLKIQMHGFHEIRIIRDNVPVPV